MQQTKSGHSKSFTSDTSLSRTRAGYANYNNMDSNWYRNLFTQDYNHTDYNHWEQLSTGSFLNPLGPCRPAAIVFADKDIPLFKLRRPAISNIMAVM
jgi:hypothetical protein